jgi:EAL domain-containing protein (putative c-di-GMP-specific phosphodiesterase class I)/GGDEF domain-containing protein
MDHFPKWKAAIYPDSQSGYQAVADGKADCMLLSNYRVSRESERLAKYKLTALVTGETMDMSFAVRQKDDCLYSILNKINHIYPNATLNSSLTKYALRDTKVTFGEFLRDNLALVIAAGAIVAALVMWLQMRNIRTEAKEAKGRQIISETEKDHLTNLYNWNYFLLYANQFSKDNPKKPMDAVDMNIDRFHSVNALHGREFGDRVLRELGAEIQRFVDETQDGSRASRAEADRFDIYCPHREDWQALLERFQARMDKLFHNANIHLRMGVKPWQEGMEPTLQFDRARIACNKKRGDFKIQAMIYDTAMGLREERDQRLLNDLGRALENHELEVYYQPKYYIQSEKPRLSSAEALVRWQHPELGLISPNEFIPLFEQSGQISILDNYVWEETVRQMAAWRDKYGKVLPVSVNLSRVDVFDPNLTSILDGLVARQGISPKYLKLEVTESAYTENAEQLIQVIEELRGKGYEIEMDDFGSGYSSLNMLSSMPIDILKMDIAFIRNIERNEKDFRLVELIVDIARYLKVPVIAEGVETVGQLKLLRDAGCDLVQGYYFSRPLPPDEFERQVLSRAIMN